MKIQLRYIAQNIARRLALWLQRRGNPVLVPVPGSEPRPDRRPRQEAAHRFRHGLRTQNLQGTGL
jgi:hypothetical protein